MQEYNKGSHTVYDIKYYVIWVTKYRQRVLNKQISSRLRELICQGCKARNITIIRGSIGKDYVHMLIGCSPNIAPSKIVQYLKGRSSRFISRVKEKIVGQHLWSEDIFVQLLVVLQKKLSESI